MAHLIRPSFTYYANADGKRVPKGTRGAKKVTEKASKWYGVGIPGQPPKKRVPLASDKEAARRMLDSMVRDAEQGRVGLPDQDASRKPLSEHLVEFERDLALGLASAKGKRSRTPDPRQVKLVVQRVRDVLGGCKFKVVADLNTSATAKLATHLSDRAKLPRSKGAFRPRPRTSCWRPLDGLLGGWQRTGLVWPQNCSTRSPHSSTRRTTGFTPDAMFRRKNWRRYSTPR